MDEKQKKVFIETKIRNLERRYSKLVQHADLTDEALEVKDMIAHLEKQL